MLPKLKPTAAENFGDKVGRVAPGAPSRARPTTARPERRARPVILLLVLLVGSNFPVFSANENRPSQFEYPPPLPGSVPWVEAQKAAQERQELYRKRIALPDAFGSNLPRANLANFANPASGMAEKPALPVAAADDLLKPVLWALGLGCLGVLLARSLTPERLAELNQRWNPWVEAPPEWALATPLSAEKVRTEDEAFAEFIKNFRGQPSAGRATDLPAEPVDLSAAFSAQSKALLGTQRVLLEAMLAEPKSLARQQLLLKLHAEMLALHAAADFPAALSVGQIAAALAGLLKQLTDKMGNVTPSSLRAVNSGVELLEQLCLPELKPELWSEPPRKFLVVDDDLISRHALSLALKKAFGSPDVVADGAAALALVQAHAYDVIFLDVQMPGMDGFELCLKIRETELNRTTPVIFVTSLSDFEARTPATLSGGNDLLAKPFLTFEITVKALTLALAGRLRLHADKLFPSPVPSVSSRPTAPIAEPSFSAPLAPSPLALTASTHLTNVFFARAKSHLGPLRELGRTMSQTASSTERQSQLAVGFVRLSDFTPQTEAELAHPAFQISAALEGLFRKLLANPKNSTDSAVATIIAAVELLTNLASPARAARLADRASYRLLVVDDDLLARRVIVGALQTAFEKPESVESGAAALTLTAEKTFDVIFLDVVMPGLDGFQVCEKIRSSARNRTTPIVLVTGQAKAEILAPMVRSGGDDLLEKPFLTAELTLKALTHAVRGRLERS